MPVCEIFDLQKAARWRDALTRFDRPDLYFGPEYLAAAEANGDGRVEAVLISNGDSHLLAPYLRCPIPDSPLFDIQGAYGYGGPLTCNASPEFLIEAWEAVERLWRNQGAAAAFLRLHPLLRNADNFTGAWSVLDDRTTASIDLSRGVGAAFGGPGAAKHRNKVARAVRLGLTVHRTKAMGGALCAFAEQYRRTMRRLNAADYYFFTDDYFETLTGRLGDATELFEVRSPGREDPMCAALILWGPRWAHYHLSARADDGENCALNLLLQRVAEVAAERGREGVHLGGGRTPAQEDSLLVFKQQIGQTRHVFQTARRILDEENYASLIAAWRLRYGRAPHWFLGYREPSPT